MYTTGYFEGRSERSDLLGESPYAPMFLQVKVDKQQRQKILQHYQSPFIQNLIRGTFYEEDN